MLQLVLTNVPPDRADAIATRLVEERLAACVSLTPIRSIYRWKGKLENEPEVSLLAKVPSRLVEATTHRLRELHPYQVPEILVLDIDGPRSHAAYLAWVDESCTTSPESPASPHEGQSRPASEPRTG